MKPQHHVGSDTPAKRWLLIAVAAAGLLVAIWWLSRPPIRLSEDHYAVTLALYRVCNQRSEAGLNQIESLLESPIMPSDEQDPSVRAIQSIILKARQSQWHQAMQQCRQLLESQVQRK